MAKRISDEIRKWADDLDSDDIVCTTATLYTLADRIDSEMAALPKTADGVLIHVGDTVYMDDGEKAEVTRIGIGMIKDNIYTIVYGEHFSLTPEHITHTRPDSLESIADELDDLSESGEMAGETSADMRELEIIEED